MTHFSHHIDAKPCIQCSVKSQQIGVIFKIFQCWIGCIQSSTVMIIRAMQRATGNINKQSLTCNLQFSLQDTHPTMNIQCNHTTFPNVYTDPDFLGRHVLCICVFCYWLKLLILSCFRSSNFLPNPVKLILNLPKFADFGIYCTYAFISNGFVILCTIFLFWYRLQE